MPIEPPKKPTIPRVKPQNAALGEVSATAVPGGENVALPVSDPDLGVSDHFRPGETPRGTAQTQPSGSIAPISPAEVAAIRRPSPAPGSRVAGVVQPLSAIRNDAGFVLGDFGSAKQWVDWCAVAGLRMWMLLPILPGGDDPSPYAACSALGKNPMLIDPLAIPEFREAGGEAALSAEARAKLAAARASKGRLLYPEIFAAKREALRLAFERFDAQAQAGGSERAKAFFAFVAKESSPQEGRWLHDYALYRAIKEEQGERSWKDWPPELRDRVPGALESAEGRLAKQVRFHQWTQWVAQTQWAEVVDRAEVRGVALFGDMPISVSHDSADAWARRDEVLSTLRLGVPPDPFSATGQDWGTTVMSNAESWLRLRARKALEEFTGVRLDHYIGFFRQYVRDRPQAEGEFVPGRFLPGDTSNLELLDSQRELGARLTKLFLDEGLRIIAEDLGVIPDGVREIARGLGVPGLEVLRWARRWDEEGPHGRSPFREPHHYHPTSVAVTGTHDTSPEAVNWEAPSDNPGEWPAYREALAAVLPALNALPRPLPAQFTPEVRDAILAGVLGSASETALIPYVDIVGGKDRINTPGRPDESWHWCLPFDSAELFSHPEPVGAARRVSQLVAESGRDSSEARYVDLDQRPR